MPEEETGTKKRSESDSSREPIIFGLRTTANREDQVMDFVTSNAEKKKYKVYSIVRAHGMRGYIFLEAETRQDAEQAAFNIPYARGVLPKEIDYKEIEHMLEMVKVEMNIRKSDIVEIISGPFKREQAKVTRIDKVKEEVVVELLEAAVPIPITVKMDAVKVVRRETEEGEEEKEEEAPVHIPSPAKKERPVEFVEEEKEELPMPGSETAKESAPEEVPEEGVVEKAKDIAEDVKEKVEEVVEDVKEAAEEAIGKIKIKKKGEKKKPKEEVKEEEELLKGEDIESIADISDEEVEEKTKEELKEKVDELKEKVEKKMQKKKKVPKEIEMQKEEKTE